MREKLQMIAATRQSSARKIDSHEEVRRKKCQTPNAMCCFMVLSKGGGAVKTPLLFGLALSGESSPSQGPS